MEQKNYPKNLEHFEARQKEIDKDEQKMISSLPKEEQEKYAAVRKALNILTEANVKAIILPELKNSKNLYDNDENKVICPYNNILNLFEKKENFVFNSEMKKESQLIDAVFGKHVKKDGSISKRKAEARLSDGYGEHYIYIKAKKIKAISPTD